MIQIIQRLPSPHNRPQQPGQCHLEQFDLERRRKRMKFVKIDSQLVTLKEDNYNSNFHTELEAPGLPIPIETPQSFKRWLPLITRSQRISAIQTLTLTPPQSRLILSASQVSL